MSVAKRIARNFSFLVASEIVTKLLLFFFVIYVTRMLGDTNFGKLSFALSFAGLFVIIADVGLNTVIIREIARERKRAREIISTSAAMKIVFSLVAFALVVSLLILFNASYEKILIVCVVFLAAIVNYFAQLYRNVFQAFERMEYEALMIVAHTFTLVLSGFFLLHSTGRLLYLVFAYLIASGANLALSMAICYKNFTTYSLAMDFSLGKALLKEGWPFALGTLFASIYFNIDMVMLGYLKGDQVTGWYSAAHRMMIVTTAIPALFAQTIYPVLSTFYRDSKKALVFAYKVSFKYLLTLAVPLGVGTMMLADRIVWFFFGQQFANSAPALRILIWAASIIFLGMLLGTTLASIYKQRTVTFATFVGALLNISLNIFLIRVYSYIGAAVATVLTELVVIFIFYRSLRKSLSVTFFDKHFFIVVLCSLLMALFIHFFTFLHLLVLIPLSAILYFWLLLLFRALDKGDREIMTQLLKINN